MIKKTGCLISSLLALFSAVKSDAQSKKPNIILILADDMGYSDLGFMGSGIKTPNIDQLAKKGIVYSKCYNTGRSCPTRASLMTGLYAHQTGMGWMTASNLGYEGYTGDLNNKCVTLAEVLKNADYSCYITGKWHLTHDSFMKPDGPKHNWPLQRGFDKYYGHLSGAVSYFNTETLTYGNDAIQTPKNFYITNAISDSTVSFLKQHFAAQKEKPFFFYVAYSAPHWYLHALPEDIAKYKAQFMNGWDQNRKQRFENLKKSGIISSKAVLTKRDPRIPAWDSLDNKQRAVWAARMAIYAAQIDCMDHGIGRIIQTLKENGEFDNTLIIFLSDNGGCAEMIGRELTIDDLPDFGSDKYNESYRVNWANVSNTPFRDYKSSAYQGGILTPMVMCWPEKIKAEGKITSQTAHIIDIMPTLLEISGATYPSEKKGKPIIPFQGKSLVSSINGKTFARGPVFFEHQASRAVIDGEWKLISRGLPKPPYKGEWELYNLKSDPTETQNLKQKYPDRVKSMDAIWEKWANENNVYPLDNSNWYEKLDKNKPLILNESL